MEGLRFWVGVGKGKGNGEGGVGEEEEKVGDDVPHCLASEAAKGRGAFVR